MLTGTNGDCWYVRCIFVREGAKVNHREGKRRVDFKAFHCALIYRASFTVIRRIDFSSFISISGLERAIRSPISPL